MCITQWGKNGCGATETRCIFAYIIIPHLTPREPVTHMKRREGFASPPPINVSCRSANFQQISHEKAGGPCGARGPPRPDPGGGRFLAPGFLRPHRSSPVSKAGLVSCLRMLVLPLKCFLNLQKFSGFLFFGFFCCCWFWSCVFFLAVVCKQLNVQKPIYLFFLGGGGRKTKRRRKAKRKTKSKRKQEGKKEREKENS